MQHWKECLKTQGIPNNWERKLEFPYLLQLFGFSDEEALAVRQMKHTNNETMEVYVLGWLSKSLCGYNISGCIVDAVNIIVAINDSINESTVDTIAAFAKALDENKLSWIPTTIIHDGELDDILAIIIAKTINPDLRIITQTPPHIVLAHDAFTDPHSKNINNFIFHKYCDMFI
jgi:hypothetical protein